MPVLVGIMIMVSIGTFDWSSFSYLRKAPKTDAIIMLTTFSVRLICQMILDVLSPARLKVLLGAVHVMGFMRNCLLIDAKRVY